MFQPDQMRGSIVPVVTPFRNGRLDATALAELIEWQIASGSHGVSVGGLTLFFLFVPFFSMGLLQFIRKENPFTLTGAWFGRSRFSHGIPAQINGCFLMAVGMIVFIALAVGLLNRLTR